MLAGVMWPIGNEPRIGIKRFKAVFVLQDANSDHALETTRTCLSGIKHSPYTLKSFLHQISAERVATSGPLKPMRLRGLSFSSNFARKR